MKNLLFFCILAFSFQLKPITGQIIEDVGQNTPPNSVQVLGTGFNAANFFDSNTPTELNWVIKWIPRGDTLLLRARFDKEVGISPFYDEIRAFNQLMIDSGRHLQIIFTANVFDNATNNMANLNWCINNNIDVICVEMGNETYAKEAGFNFNFLSYQNAFEPITEQIEATYPNLPISIFVAPRPKDEGIPGGRTDHKKFNDNVKIYIKDKPLTWGISDHIYMNEKEVLHVDTVPLQRNMTAYQPDLDALYQSFLDAVYRGTGLNTFDSTMDYLYDNFPGRKFYITEFQYSNSATNKNMLWNGIATFMMWQHINKYPNAYFLEHMAKGNTNAANISNTSTGRRDDYDLNPTGSTMLRRVNYWVYEMYRKYPKGVPRISEQTLTLERPGTYYYWFANDGDLYDVNLNLSQNLELGYFNTEYITGTYIYSSAGIIIPMGTGTPKSYEINGLRHGTGLVIPGLSCGYATIQVLDNTILGCMDTSYMEYNEIANTSEPNYCITKKVWGCMDNTYVEYNPLANMSNPAACRTKIVIEPVICYKERIIFKSWGCKIDKNCRINNCKPNSIN